MVKRKYQATDPAGWIIRTLDGKRYGNDSYDSYDKARRAGNAVRILSGIVTEPARA